MTRLTVFDVDGKELCHFQNRWNGEAWVVEEVHPAGTRRTIQDPADLLVSICNVTGNHKGSVIRPNHT